MLQINEYIKENRLQLNTLIKECKTIYLDTNFWIKLREQNSKREPNERKFLTLVTELVESKKCIFPISEITFREILKQKDSQTLRETIQLIDKFSRGISIINEHERRQLEYENFIRKNTGKEVYDVKELVWSKVAFIVCYDMLLMIKSLPEQKSFCDFLNKLSLLDIIFITDGNGGIEPFTFKDNVEVMNQNKQQYANENKSFKQMFLSELGGYIDLYQDSLSESMFNLFYIESGRFPTEEEKSQVNLSTCKTLIYNFFKKNKITKELPTFRIIPSLFASVRWNKTRKYSDGNDTIDFLHASSALPYYDFFFTEKELRTIIKQLKFDSLYECRVESDPNEVFKILESLK